jgi:hypothetical protein
MIVTVSFCLLSFTNVIAYPLGVKRTTLATLRTVVSFPERAVAPFPAALKFPTTAPVIVRLLGY